MSSGQLRFELNLAGMARSATRGRAMPRIVNIRNVAEEVYRKLKIRAAKEGLTIPALFRREFRKLVEEPIPDEPPVTTGSAARGTAKGKRKEC